VKADKLISKSFEKLLERGKARGFITHEELKKSLGKRNSTPESLEKAVLNIFDNLITLVKQKSEISLFQNHLRNCLSVEKLEDLSLMKN